jgi:uncharacterized membrane protein
VNQPAVKTALKPSAPTGPDTLPFQLPLEEHAVVPFAELLSDSAEASSRGRSSFPPGLRHRLGLMQAAVSWPNTIIVLVVNVLVVTGLSPPAVRPVLAVGMLVVTPTRLLTAKVRWGTQDRSERLVMSLAVVVLALLLGGLALNTLLPVLGVARPLDPLPVLLTVDAGLLALLRWRPQLRPDPWTLPRWRHGCLFVPWSPMAAGLVTAAAFGALMAVAGAVRLNNGGDGDVTFCALLIVIATFAAALLARHRVAERGLHLVIFLQSSALLLMTSLRGQYITGHDVQHEFRVFDLVSAAGRWKMAANDAYNACLSITILPTVMHAIAGGDPSAVFKVFLTLLFAVTPVAIYLIARRQGSTGASLLAVIFFVGFPTFFSDMPFLNRQEVAFFFLAVATLSVLQSEVRVGQRRWTFGVFCVGTVLSHYSTTYVLIAVLWLAWVLKVSTPFCGRLLGRAKRVPARQRPAPARPTRNPGTVIGVVNVAALALVAFVWTVPLTHSGGQVVTTMRLTTEQLLHLGGGASRSADVGYSLFSRRQPDPAQEITAFRADTITATAADRASGVYLPLSTVERYATPVARATELPLTPLGSTLARADIDVGLVNSVIRSVAARLLQIFVCVGLLVGAMGLRSRFRPPTEMVHLGVACFAVVISQVILPQLSVDYGVLRAFQQALIMLAPFLAAGVMTSLAWLRGWGNRAAGGFALVYLASLVGVIPQATGGYPAQLHLNNSGPYYDMYYVRPQEVAAITWLTASNSRVRGTREPAEVDSDGYTANRLLNFGLPASTADIYPTLLRTDSYVLLGVSTADDGRSVISYEGDQITYIYPMGLLRQTKNRLYDNGSAEVYR